MIRHLPPLMLLLGLAIACSGKFTSLPEPGGECSQVSGASDGKCELLATDPCRSRDPDCVPVSCALVDCASVGTEDGVCSAGATFSPCCGWSDPDCGKIGVTDCRERACPVGLAASDGVCSQAAPDACCGYSDPDCPAPDCTNASCLLLIEAPDGVCSRGPTDCCRGNDPDCSPDCERIACAPRQPSDGVCSEAEPTQCCGFSDPDCEVACLDIACASEPSDGFCSQEAPTPCCGYTDPDCPGPVGYNCDISKVACDLAVSCEPGKVPTAEGLCYGPCVVPEECTPGTIPAPVCPPDAACPPFAASPADGYCPGTSATEPGCCGFDDEDCANVYACKGAGCAEYIEESDGKCTRELSDCCRTQDPDCSSVGGSSVPFSCGNIACAAEAPDGICRRTPDDCCWRADPDCGG
jgi:hypothetical protein